MLRNSRGWIAFQLLVHIADPAFWPCRILLSTHHVMQHAALHGWADRFMHKSQISGDIADHSKMLEDAIQSFHVGALRPLWQHVFHNICASDDNTLRSSTPCWISSHEFLFGERRISEDVPTWRCAHLHPSISQEGLTFYTKCMHTFRRSQTDSASSFYGGLEVGARASSCISLFRNGRLMYHKIGV